MAKANKQFRDYGLEKKNYPFGIDYYNTEKDLLVHFDFENKEVVVETYYNQSLRVFEPRYDDIEPDEELKEIIELKKKELGWI